MNIRIIALGFLLVTQNSCATTLTIHNQAYRTVYACLYYVDSNIWGSSTGPATRYGTPVEIFPQESAQLYRPLYISTQNKEIIFSTKKDDLKDTLDVDAYTKTAKHAAGWFQGTVYHIVEKDKVLHGYTSTEYILEKPINDFAENISAQLLSLLQTHYSNHPYAKTTATVRLTDELDRCELQATSNRLIKVNATLSNLLSMQIDKDHTPRIALCLSGGGMRAATCAYGLIAGLDDIGLLDAVTYCAALSGSTWLLTDWILFGQPLTSYHTHFWQALSCMRPVPLVALSNVLWPKYIFNQDTSIVDYYGAYLAHAFFFQIHDTVARQAITLSFLGNLIQDGSWPLPLYTAVETSAENHWVTFTPFEVGSDTMHFHIPTWSFGRKFAGGISTDFAPELSLGYHMGIWGSALSGSLQDMLGTVTGLNSILMNALTHALIESGAGDLRFAAIKIYNPLYGSQESAYRTRNMKELIFMDAGYAYNLPLLPVLKKERAVDIIIILDASQNVHEGTPELKKALADLEAQGIQLPPIDLSQDIQQPISIFKDPNNPDIPTIIYVMPTKEDSYDPLFDPAKEFSTTYNVVNFSYSRENIERLVGLLRYSIGKNRESIIGTIKNRLVKSQARSLCQTTSLIVD